MVVDAGRGAARTPVFVGDRVSGGQDDKSSGDGWRWQLQNRVNVLSATELGI